MTDRLKVGVVGAGVIAQVMHLNYLRELSDRFEIVALCDISDENAANNAHRYNISKTFTDWREMLDGRRHRRRLHSDFGQSCADRHRCGESGQARLGGEADVLLRRRRSGDEGRPPRRQG